MNMKTDRFELTPAKGLLFDEEKHEYWLNGKQLSGITGVIHRNLFPDEFSNIPPRILQASAEYGHSVHSAIADFDMLYINNDTVEVNDYATLCREHHLAHEASEFLISDGANYASSIDKIYRTGNNSFSIGDIKTYYGKLRGDKLTKCRWQLSLYCYMLELQSPGIVIDKLFVLHLRNKQRRNNTFDHIREIVYVDRIPADVCKALLDADLAGVPFVNPYAALPAS